MSTARRPGATVRTRPPPWSGPAAALALVDVFVYVVVLNLFVEYLPSVISESFSLSLLTAVVLKAVMEVVVAVKNRLKTRWHRAATARGRAVAGVALWLTLVGSKFLVLEIVHLIFGDRVRLGGFVSVTLLIVVLLAARALVRSALPQPVLTPDE